MLIADNFRAVTSDSPSQAVTQGRVLATGCGNAAGFSCVANPKGWEAG
jgi:hypothetical protein